MFKRQDKHHSNAEGFIAFALDFKRKLDDKGFGIDDIDEVKEMARPHWEKLTDNEKKKFEIGGHTLETNKKEDRKRRLKGLNTQITQKIEQQENDLMAQEINFLVTQAADLGELEDFEFYFISAAASSENDNEAYPAEIAMAKFSLKKEIIADVHIRIHPEDAPLQSHNHLIPPNCEGEKDYLEVLEKMIKFLHPMEKLPIFFTEGNTRDNQQPLITTRKVVAKILYECQEDDLLDDVRIYPVENLFFALLTTIAITKKHLEGRASDLPEREDSNYKFDYGLRLSGVDKACRFHNDRETPLECCLYKVRQYGYTIARYCANQYKEIARSKKELERRRQRPKHRKNVKQSEHETSSDED